MVFTLLKDWIEVLDSRTQNDNNAHQVMLVNVHNNQNMDLLAYFIWRDSYRALTLVADRSL
jgi:hypothetical protein